MAKNFVVKDSDGDVIWEAPENARVLSLSVRTDRGEAAKVALQDDTYIALFFETTGRLNPNLIDEEEARRESQRNFARQNSPESVSLTQEQLDDPDNEEAQEFKRREGTAAAADFTLTKDQPGFKEADPQSPAGPDTQFTDTEKNSGTTPASPGPFSLGNDNDDNS